MAEQETTIDEFVPTQVEEAAYDVLSQLLPEMTLIYEQQNHQSPAMPYATLWVMSSPEVGGISFGPVNDEGIQTFHQVIEGTVSLKVFGGLARQHLENVRSRSKKPTMRDVMTKRRFIIFGTDDVLPLDKMRSDVYYEPCAVLDMKFRYTARFTDNVGVIEHVIGNGTLNDVAVSFDIEITTPGA